MYAVLNVCFHLCAATPLPSQGRGRGGVSVNLAQERFVPHPSTPSQRSPKKGKEWLRTDGNTHLKRNTKHHSSLNYVEVPTAILLPKQFAPNLRANSSKGGAHVRWVWWASMLMLHDKTPDMCGEDDGMVNEKRQNGRTNPLELFYKSIDFVRRFHWFC